MSALSMIEMFITRLILSLKMVLHNYKINVKSDLVFICFYKLYFMKYVLVNWYKNHHGYQNSFKPNIMGHGSIIIILNIQI